MAQNVGRIYIDGKPYGEDLPYAIQRMKIKGLIMNGINENRIELHKPIYHGIAYCKKCAYMAVKPRTYTYGPHEYWRCQCGQMNYVS